MKTMIDIPAIKSVEPFYFTSIEEQITVLEKAFYNPFTISSRYLIRTAEYLVDRLKDADVPAFQAMGGHAVYLDAKEFLQHLSAEEYPAQTLVAALYTEGGIRSVEMGSLTFGERDEQGRLLPAAMELVRLMIPRKMYTQTYIDHVANVIISLYKKRRKLKGLELADDFPMLRYFMVKDPGDSEKAEQKCNASEMY